MEEKTTSLRARSLRNNVNPFSLHDVPCALGASFMPSFKGRIRQTLSLKDNPQLLENWEKFMNNPGSGPVVRLFPDILADCKKNTIVRRMELNGQFYNRNGKLTPVPVDKLADKDVAKMSSKSTISNAQ